MNNCDNLEIAKAWIEFTKSEYESDAYERNFWAFQIMSDMSHSGDVSRVLEIVSIILSIDNSDIIVGMLGAGPVEDLLIIHGPKVVGLIEDLVANNPDIVYALKGVWNTRIESDVWDRVSKYLN